MLQKAVTTANNNCCNLCANLNELSRVAASEPLSASLCGITNQRGTTTTTSNARVRTCARAQAPNKAADGAFERHFIPKILSHCSLWLQQVRHERRHLKPIRFHILMPSKITVEKQKKCNISFHLNNQTVIAQPLHLIYLLILDVCNTNQNCFETKMLQ